MIRLARSASRSSIAQHAARRTASKGIGPNLEEASRWCARARKFRAAYEHRLRAVGRSQASVSVSEENLATRLLADLSVVSSTMVVGEQEMAGFAELTSEVKLDFVTLRKIYISTPGLVADKL